jgi:xanthine dehydrogenase accessory factor
VTILLSLSHAVIFNDLDVLREVIVHQSPGYIGMIGSRRKKKDFFYTIKKEGISSQRLDEIHAPIGLNIHAETPAEIIQVRGKQRP